MDFENHVLELVNVGMLFVVDNQMLRPPQWRFGNRNMYNEELNMHFMKDISSVDRREGLQ